MAGDDRILQRRMDGPGQDDAGELKPEVLYVLLKYSLTNMCSVHYPSTPHSANSNV